MNTSAIAKTPLEIINSKDRLAAVIFFNNKSSRFGAALLMAQGAAGGFLEFSAGEKTTGYAAGFDATPQDAAKLITLMSIISGFKGTQLFIRGAPVKWGWAIERTLECFIKSSHHEQPREYCMKVHPYGEVVVSVLQIRLPGTIPFQEPEPDKKFLVLPCRNLAGWRVANIENGPSKRSQILSDAIETNVHWCPRFNIDNFLDQTNDGN